MRTPHQNYRYYRLRQYRSFTKKIAEFERQLREREPSEIRNEIETFLTHLIHERERIRREFPDIQPDIWSIN